jgi:uncharacterized protein
LDRLKLTTRDERVIVEVHVVPRASKTALAGVHDGRLKVTLAAPPVEGAANAALVGFLAKRLGRPRRDVELLRGETSRRKTLAIRGLSLAEVRARLV